MSIGTQCSFSLYKNQFDSGVSAVLSGHLRLRFFCQRIQFVRKICWESQLQVREKFRKQVNNQLLFIAFVTRKAFSSFHFEATYWQGDQVGKLK